jgi:aminopeptidase-like protein
MPDKTPNEMMKLMRKLYPICRSITGDGVRETLEIISEQIPLKMTEVKTGTKAFDWTVPKEWNIKDAFIKDSRGKKIVDFKKSNIHVLGYSGPIHKKMTLRELKEHLFSLPKYPDWIPYVTSYYQENWGFCLTDRQLKKLKEDMYEVSIDSSLRDGFLTLGEFVVPGKTTDEVLISSYLCHPSLANDNLSGTVLATFLAKEISKMKLHYSYRFLFVPETIGAITWLSRNEKNISKIKHGLVATCVGDKGQSTYKKSRQGNAEIDKAAEKVLLDSGQPFEIIDFFPSGSDERQYCSPAFDLPVGSLMRTMYGKFPQYHSSADNLDFIKPAKLADSLDKYLKIIFVLENNKTYINLNPKCEPQLGRRGLYSLIGSQKEANLNELAIFWILNLSDGKNNLLDISLRSKLDFQQIKEAADALENANLLKKVKPAAITD